jgi:hypothetical protein
MPTQIATIAMLSGVVLTLTVAPAAAQNRNIAGHIKVASGSVFVIRAGAELPAAVGQAIYETDSVKTGADGRLGLTLKDDTRVSLGPLSEMRIASFQFAPAESRLEIVLTFVRGVVGYVSGRIAKLAPDSVRLETPAAIIGVRGTTLAVRVAS